MFLETFVQFRTFVQKLLYFETFVQNFCILENHETLYKNSVLFLPHYFFFIFIWCLFCFLKKITFSTNKDHLHLLRLLKNWQKLDLFIVYIFPKSASSFYKLNSVSKFDFCSKKIPGVPINCFRIWGPKCKIAILERVYLNSVLCTLVVREWADQVRGGGVGDPHVLR